MINWIIGAIAVLGVVMGTYTFGKLDKIKGIGQIILAVVCPGITISFLSLKAEHAFGGTDWEFLIHSATIDGNIWPWISLVLYITEFVCIAKTMHVVDKNSDRKLKK